MRPSRARRHGGILARREASVAGSPLESTRRDARTRDALHGERGSTLARVAALGALVAAVALIAIAMFGGGDGYKVKAVFQNAGQLVPGNPVQVGGGKIGTVDEIELDDNAQAVVTLKVDDDFGRLHEGTTATIRATSLSGIANRYVSLQPGPNNNDEIDDGGQIGADDTTAPVDIDTLFNTLDDAHAQGPPGTSSAASATSTTARASRRSEATKYFSPFLVSTSDLTRELALDQKVLERFVTDTSNAVTAIAERRDDLADLVTQREHRLRRDRRRERGARPGARAAARHPAQGEHDVREPALHARRPRQARGRVEAGHAPARPVPARAAPARARRPPDDRRPEHAGAQPGREQRPDRADREAAAPGGAHRLGLPARDQHARPRPAGVRVRAQLHARPGGLGHQLRPAGRQLRRQRPLRARAADVPALHASRAARSRRTSPARSSTASTPATSRAARAAIMQPAPDGSSPVPVGQ